MTTFIIGNLSIWTSNERFCVGFMIGIMIFSITTLLSLSSRSRGQTDNLSNRAVGHIAIISLDWLLTVDNKALKNLRAKSEGEWGLWKKSLFCSEFYSSSLVKIIIFHPYFLFWMKFFRNKK